MEVKMAQSDGKISVDLDLIAKQLLQERFILTALELYTEVMEVGHEIPRLRDYFSNPSNFELCSKPSTELLPPASLNRSYSQTTLDSLDWARYSEDGERVLDDRIAVLEFELRKAKETIQGLRDNLTQATAPSEPCDNTIMFGCGNRSGDPPNGDMKPHEVCTLNFLINEYLVLRNYKMTANTFADENDNQDFENWDAVGLNIPRPPPLVQWLQEKVPRLSLKLDASCQTDLDTLELDYLQESLQSKNFLEEKVKELESRCERQELELQKLHRKMSAPQVMPLVTANLDLNRDSSNKAPTPFTQDESQDCIEFEPTKVTVSYSKNGVSFPGTEVPDSQKRREETLAIFPTSTMEGFDMDPPLSDQKKLGDDVLDVSVPEIQALIEDSSYLDPCEGSIEDLIESPSATLAAQSPRDVPLSISSLSVGGVFSYEEEKENGVVENPINHESGVQDSPQLFSEETSDVLDPRKCDRLPPLGASSECSPQGILAGEFITAQRDEARSLLRSSTQREVPPFLESQVLAICFGQTLGVDSRLQNEVAALSLGQCDLLNLVSSSVHNIAPNVILSKREELLPLLVYSISQHADSREREGLLHLLFNLTKRPDREQRSTILLGLVNLARVLGADKLEAELLPQCWEQLSHKHPERRLLVAQSVAILAPYTPPPLRNSLLLSMLQQLLGAGGEKEAMVREAAMASLALVVAYLDDTTKLLPLVETLLLCLQRVEPRRGEFECGRPASNAYLLLDAVAHWTLRADRFPLFVDAQLQRLGELADELVRASGEGSVRGSGVEQLGVELANLCRGLGASIPHIFLFLFESIGSEGCVPLSPPPGGALPLTPSSATLAFFDELSVVLGGRDEAERSLLVLHRRLGLEVSETPWPEITYLLESVLPCLVQTLSHLQAQPRGVVTAFVDLFSRLSACLGPCLRHDAIAPLLRTSLEVTEGDFASIRASALTKSPFVVYCVAVLGESDPDTKVGELRQFLAHQISNLALSGASTDALQLALLLLMTSSPGQEEVLGALWDSVVQASTVVRAATAPLWSLIAGHLKEPELASRVVPALVTLATDTDVAVRASAITPLAVILSNSSSKEVKDKVLLQLESVCEESQVLENPALQVAIAQTCCSLAHNTPSHLLHNLFLPLLCRVALEGSGCSEEKLQFGVALLEAFTALAPSPMPNVLVAHFILPPLNQLQRSLGVLSYEHMEMITVLTKEYTLRAQSTPAADRHRSGSIGAGIGGGLQAGVGVEDVKNRMSKMWSSTGRSMSSGLQGKTPSLTLPTLFKKK